MYKTFCYIKHGNERKKFSDRSCWQFALTNPYTKFKRQWKIEVSNKLMIDVTTKGLNISAMIISAIKFK